MATPKKDSHHFVQTKMDSHRAWAHLCIKEPRASAVLHLLCSLMKYDHDPAIVISQKLIAKLLGCSERTIRRAVQVLEDNRWFEVERIGSGNVNAYKLNKRVAYANGRDDTRYGVFSATVVVDQADQGEISEEDLREVSWLVDGNVVPRENPLRVVKDSDPANE